MREGIVLEIEETRSGGRPWWVAIAASLVLGVAALIAPNYIEWCASPRACAVEARAHAAQLDFAGKQDAALSVLMRAHARYPDPATSAALVQHFERRQAPARALHFALEAHQRAPQDARYAADAARRLLDVDPKRAARIAEAVIARDPSHVGARITRSQIARSAGDSDRALAEARLLATPDQTDPAAWHHLGRLIKMDVHDILAEGGEPDDGLFDEGIEALSRAAALEPENWVARLERVWLLSVWPGHREEATDAAWRAYRATFATVPAEILERQARSEMLTLARRLGDGELIRATERAEPGSFGERPRGS
jgi:tetratricopeptide (TPR) repeat protein